MTHSIASLFPPAMNHMWIMATSALVLVLGGSISRIPVAWLTTVGSIAAAAAAVFGMQDLGNLIEVQVLWSSAVVVDSAAVAAGVVCALATAAVLAVSVKSQTISQSAERHWPGMVMLTSSALMFAVHANHLGTLLVATEAAALGHVALLGVGRAQARGSEAASKAVVVGAVAFGLCAFGMALIFGGSAGLMDYGSLANAFSAHGPSAVAMVGAMFVLAAFLFRIGAAPFHMANADLIDGAPLPASMFSVSAFRICFVVAMLRLLKLGFLSPGVSADVTGIAQILGWVAALSMLVGSIGAVRQESLKRTLAYLALLQIGFSVLAIVALSQGAPMAVTALGTCLLGQVLALSIAFAALLQLTASHEGFPFVDDLAGLAQVRPLLAFSIAVSLLSVSGMPFTVGFGGFFSVLLSVFSTPLMLPLGCIGLLAFLVGLYPALRVIVAMYFRESARTWPEHNPPATAAVLCTGTLAMLLFGVITAPWLQWSRHLVP
jgi:NADH-quinone oxidoreductase subunit N